MKALILISTLSMILISGAVFAQTGKCREARDVVIDKTWGGIKYKYSPQFIEDNKAMLTKAVETNAAQFLKDCDSVTPSDEQIILQGALTFGALPVKLVADIYLEALGLPKTGDKTFHIDVKDIEKNGIFGGKNSVFRKPFG
jgi:hypothetical protein